MRSVPLLHQQVNHTTNSTPLQDALTANAGRWAALGINTRSILPSLLPQQVVSSSQLPVGIVVSSSVRPIDLHGHHSASSSQGRSPATPTSSQTPLLQQPAAAYADSEPLPQAQQHPSPTAHRITSELQRVTPALQKQRRQAIFTPLRSLEVENKRLEQRQRRRSERETCS